MPVQFPAFWWGRPSAQPVAPTIAITELLRQHVLSAGLAGLLWALLVRRASMLAVAGYYSGAGKTTTLTALTSFYPPDSNFVVARGRAEDFSFVGQVTPDETTLLVPEFSDHMPGYLWGPGAARIFELRKQGFTFAGTMHAHGVEDVLTQLTQPPVSLRSSTVSGTLQIILIQNMIEEIEARRVTGVSWVYPTPRGPGGLGVKGLAAWNPRDDLWHLFSSPETWEQLARWCATETGALQREVEARTAFLERLLATGVFDFDAVHQQLVAFRA